MDLRLRFSCAVAICMTLEFAFCLAVKLALP